MHITTLIQLDMKDNDKKRYTIRHKETNLENSTGRVMKLILFNLKDQGSLKATAILILKVITTKISELINFRETLGERDIHIRRF